MAPHFIKNKRRRLRQLNSSDTDDSIIEIIRRKQLVKTKMLQTSLQSLCDDDEDKSSSDNTSISKRKSDNNKGHDTQYKTTNTTKRDSISKVRDEDNGNKETNDSNAKSDKENVECVDTRNISTDSPKSSVNTDIRKDRSFNSDEDSCDSWLSTGKSKTRYVRQSQFIESNSGMNGNTLENVKACGSTAKQNTYRNKTNSNNLNYNLILLTIINKVRDLFSKFELHMNHLQEKYLKEESMQNDIGDVMFIFNCILSKLKEDLNAHQQDLTQYYVKWDVTHKEQNKRNSKHGSPINLNSRTQDDSDSEQMFSPNPSKTVPLKVTKIKKINKGNQLLTEKKNTKSLVKVQSNVNDNNNLNSKSGISITESSVLNYFNNVDTTKKTTQIPSKKTKFSKPFLTSSTMSQQQELHEKICEGGSPIIIEDLISSSPMTEKDQSSDCNSDVNSTCSTVALIPRKRYQDSSKNDTQMSAEGPNSCSSGSTSSEDLPINIKHSRRLGIDDYDSDDTIIFSRKTNRKIPKTKKTFETPMNESSNPKQNSKFLVPGMRKFPAKNRRLLAYISDVSNRSNVNSKKPKYKNKSYGDTADKKLQMNCQVFVEKMKVNSK